MKLGGLVTMGVGIALMIFMGSVAHDARVAFVGLIPFLVGVALLVYTYILGPKE
jgi:hypothetical protein